MVAQCTARTCLQCVECNSMRKNESKEIWPGLSPAPAAGEARFASISTGMSARFTHPSKLACRLVLQRLVLHSLFPTKTLSLIGTDLLIGWGPPNSNLFARANCANFFPTSTWHLGSLTAANWVSFDFNVSYSSCWGYSLINTLKSKNLYEWLFFQNATQVDSLVG